LKILVLHGPNLNLLGRREPHLYGSKSLDDINVALRSLARELDVEPIVVQSNHEGRLLEALHEHWDVVQGAIVNPAGLTQHGVSLHDAIKTMPFPVVEVHMTNIEAREEWRGHSIISPAVKATVQGFGWRSYVIALRALVESLQAKD